MPTGELQGNFKGKAGRDRAGKRERAPFDALSRGVLRDNRADRTAVGAGTALGAIVGNFVLVTGLDNGRNRAGVDASAAGDTFLSDFHETSSLVDVDGVV